MVLLEDCFDDQRQRIMHNGKTLIRRIQKGVDVGLVMHMVDSHRRKRWKNLVLAASDADFAEPVQRLVKFDDVTLSILGIPKKVSQTLRPYTSGGVIDLRQIKDRIERRDAAVLRPSS